MYYSNTHFRELQWAQVKLIHLLGWICFSSGDECGKGFYSTGDAITLKIGSSAHVKPIHFIVSMTKTESIQVLLYFLEFSYLIDGL